MNRFKIELMLFCRNFLILFFLFSSFIATAQTDSLELKADSLNEDESTTAYEEKENRFTTLDTTSTKQRGFAQDQIQKLKADPDLNYQQPPTVAESLWDRIKQWFLDFISQFIRGATSTNIGRFVLFIAGAALIIFLVLMFLKQNAFRMLFSNENTTSQQFQFIDENIHEMDFEKLLADAVEKKNYRFATRLIFLNTLKILSDQHLIDWNPAKTNHDYVEELQRTDLKTGFNKLSMYFDYAWYGNFNVSPEIFQEVKNTFNDLKATAR